MPAKPKKSKTEKESTLSKWSKVATAILAILGLLFLIFPDLKPAGSPDIELEIDSIAVEQDVSFESYIMRNQLQTPEGFDCVELKSNGMIINPTLKLTGLKNILIQARWSIYSMDNRLVPSEWYLPQLLYPPLEYTPKKQKEIWVFENWLPHPRAIGDFYVRLEIFMQSEDTFRSLGYKNTDAFPVSLFPECAGAPPFVPFPPDAEFQPIPP